MTVLLIFFHSVACIFLTMVILMQAGRGGGLTEGFASAESMFGARTNEFMVRTTVVLAGIFLTTSLILAYMSSKKEKSIIPSNITTHRLPNVTIPINATDLPRAETKEAEMPIVTKSNEPASTGEITNKVEDQQQTMPGENKATEIPMHSESPHAAMDNRVP